MEIGEHTEATHEDEVGEGIDPSELRSLRIPRAMRGYSRRSVDRLRELLAESVEQLHLEREDLRAKLRSAIADRELLSREVDRIEAARVELADAVEHVTGERQALLASFDEASLEREKLLETFEQMTRERQELHDHSRRLEEQVTRCRELERTLTEAIAAAERSGDEVRLQAQREAELIISEARVEARRIVLAVENEIGAIHSQLRASLASLEHPAGD